MLRIVLDYCPPTLNYVLRMNYFARMRLKSQILVIISKAIKRKPDSPFEKFTVCITRHGKRELDFDNAVSSYKMIMDCLIEIGVIAGDEYRRTGSWIFSQVKIKKGEKEKSEITIIPS